MNNHSLAQCNNKDFDEYQWTLLIRNTGRFGNKKQRCMAAEYGNGSWADAFIQRCEQETSICEDHVHALNLKAFAQQPLPCSACIQLLCVLLTSPVISSLSQGASSAGTAKGHPPGHLESCLTGGRMQMQT